MRIVGALLGLIMAVLAATAAPGSAIACEPDGQKVAPATDQLEGKIAALFTAQVARPSESATSLGVTLLVRSDDRIVTVIVLEGAQIFSSDGAAIAADEIPPGSSVLLTGRWTNQETFEATRVQVQ